MVTHAKDEGWDRRSMDGSRERNAHRLEPRSNRLSTSLEFGSLFAPGAPQEIQDKKM